MYTSLSLYACFLGGLAQLCTPFCVRSVKLTDNSWDHAQTEPAWSSSPLIQAQATDNWSLGRFQVNLGSRVPFHVEDCVEFENKNRIFFFFKFFKSFSSFLFSIQGLVGEGVRGVTQGRGSEVQGAAGLLFRWPDSGTRGKSKECSRGGPGGAYFPVLNFFSGPVFPRENVFLWNHFRCPFHLNFSIVIILDP